MLSSSLFLRSSTTLVSILSFVSLPSFTDAQYIVKNTYQGSDFVRSFSLFDGPDPTNGYVTYSDATTSYNDGRITFNDGRFQMRVDSTTTTDPNGAGRGSVRIESIQTWTKGLFVADFAQLPERQCGIWPAWWTLGDNWPNNGEIDILEGVSVNQQNVASLHTARKSDISPNPNYQTGIVQTTNCNYNNPKPNSVGCGIIDRDPNSFGSAQGQKNARAVAMEWTSDSIKVWNFARSDAPPDMFSASPDPSRWGAPAQDFTGPDVNIDANFNANRMIFDTTLCGDYAGADGVWNSDGGCGSITGNPSCINYVANNPDKFKNTYWDINLVMVFQRNDGASTTSSSSTSTTSTTSSLTTSSLSSSTSPSSISSRTSSSSLQSTSSTSTISSESTISTSGSASSTTSSITSTSMITSTMTSTSTITLSSVTTTASQGPIVTDVFVLAVDFTQPQRKRQTQQYIGFDGNTGIVGNLAAFFSFDSDGYLMSDQSFISDNPLALAQNFLKTGIRPNTPRFRLVNGELVRDDGLFCALSNNEIIVYNGAANKPAACRDFRAAVQAAGSMTPTTSSTTSSNYEWQTWSFSSASSSTSAPSSQWSEWPKTLTQSMSTWEEWSTAPSSSMTSSVWKPWSTPATLSSQWKQWTSVPTSAPSQWMEWSTSTPGASSWSAWSKTTTTITKTYVVPCPTGLETKTITVTTAYSQATNPTIPMTTYVTTCPPEWGFGGPITVTVPVTSTMWETWNGKPTDTMATWEGKSANTWEAVNEPKTTATGTWEEWSKQTPSSSAGWENWNEKPQTATNVWEDVKPATASMSKSSEWNAWATSATPSTQAWNFWTETARQPAAATYTGNSGIKTYTGSASKSLPAATMFVVVMAALFGVMIM